MPDRRIAVAGCPDERLVEALVQLGFAVHACDRDASRAEHVRAALAATEGHLEVVPVERYDVLPYDDAAFDWVVSWNALGHLSTRERWLETLQELRRILAPGGWLYAVVDGVPELPSLSNGQSHYASDSGLHPRFTPDTLADLFADARFAVAEAPTHLDGDDGPLVRGIFRRVEPGMAA